MRVTLNDNGQEIRPRALITGASAGIGLAFAWALAKRGYDLTLVARRRERLGEIAQELIVEHPISVQVLARDLGSPKDLEQVEQFLRDEPSIDLLINNAGFGSTGSFDESDPEFEEAEIRLNVLAVVRLTRAILPQLIHNKRGGVINVSSMAGFQCGPFNATYSATKAYVTSFSEAIAEELGGSGVRVQALCPGFTRTEFHDRAEWDTGNVPARAWLSAEEVVEASLRAYDRDQVICIPSLRYKLLALGSKFAPRSIARKITGKLARKVKEQ